MPLAIGSRMSDKKRQKKDGLDKNKRNQARRAKELHGPPARKRKLPRD
jgi:hypothetical protein